MNEVTDAKVQLKLAGETFRFLYNKEKKEVYNELFPGIKIDKIRTACGHTINHDLILKMVQDKAEEFELAIAKAELLKAIESFESKDYSDLF